MESGGSVPSGEPLSGAPDAPLEASGEGGLPGIGGALILPVFFTLAAWTVDRFTRSALGDRRYLPTAVLGLCAVNFTVLAVIVAVLQFDRVPAWLARPVKVMLTSNVLFAALFVVVVCVDLVRALRDRSALDALSVVVLVAWGASILATDGLRRPPRALRWLRRWAGVILPLWFTVLAVFSLR